MRKGVRDAPRGRNYLYAAWRSCVRPAGELGRTAASSWEVGGCCGFSRVWEKVQSGKGSLFGASLGSRGVCVVHGGLGSDGFSSWPPMGKMGLWHTLRKNGCLWGCKSSHGGCQGSKWMARGGEKVVGGRTQAAGGSGWWRDQKTHRRRDDAVAG